MKETVKFSTNLSITVQLITTLILFQGIFINLTGKKTILNSLFRLELFVQIIQMTFYIYVLKTLSETSIELMAINRYNDWIITTPLMLISIIIYFTYEEFVEKNKEENIEFFEFINEHKITISIILLANLLMLLLGYLGELSIINNWVSIIFGFIFFIIVFYTIYDNYASKSKRGKIIFNFIVTIWGLYGVGHVLDIYSKNNMYNILDIFSKNFFGLYLFFRAKELM